MKPESILSKEAVSSEVAANWAADDVKEVTIVGTEEAPAKGLIAVLLAFHSTPIKNLTNFKKTWKRLTQY